MKKRTFMTLSFFFVLAFGFLLGGNMVGMPRLGASLLGLVLAFIGLFAGMVLAYMHLYSEIHAAEVRQSNVDGKREEFEERMRDLAGRQDAMQDDALLEFAKALSQKVANSILAKHFDGLLDESKRATLFKDVDAIIEEETKEAGLELAKQHDRSGD